MSITSQLINKDDCAFEAGCDVVEMLITPQTKDLGEFSVRRCLPNARRKMVGPWIFFDHAGPANFPAGKGTNVRPHPHIGLATVTYLFDGEMLHRDSLGSEQVVRPGDINLMVAGKGIVHSERERQRVRDIPHSLHALQLWLALPVADEQTDPEFLHYPANDIPVVTVAGVPVRVMMGSAFSTESPVKTFADTLYLEAKLRPGESLPTPAADERAIYVVTGKITVGSTAVAEHSMAILKPGSNSVITAEVDSQIAIIGGEALGKRYIEWNFVSSDKERIDQAKSAWKNGDFPVVPGDEEEFIPLPD